MTGARPRLSSSSSSSRGSRASARPTASICCSPPESRPARRERSGAERREVLVGVLGVEPLAAVAEAEVLGDGEAEEQRRGPRARGRCRAGASVAASDLRGVGAVEDDPAARAGARGPRSLAASSSCRRRWARAARRPRRRRRAGRGRGRPARRRSRRSGPRCSAPRRSSGLDVERVGRAVGRRRRRGRPRPRAGRGAPPRACRSRSPCRTRARRCWSQTPSTRPMSWSTSSIAVPPSTTSRSWRPSCSLSAESRPAAGLVEAHDARRAGQRARDADQLALALRELGRQLSASRSRPSSVERVVDRGAVRRRLPEDLADGRPARRARGRDGEVLAHGEVVEELGRLPRARRGRCAPARAAPAARARGRRARRARCERTKPVIASMKVVLPAPLGPISPTSLPSGDLELDVDERVHAAEAHRDAAGARAPRSSLARRPRHRRALAAGAGVARVGRRPASASSSASASPATPSGNRTRLRISVTPADEQRPRARRSRARPRRCAG